MDEKRIEEIREHYEIERMRSECKRCAGYGLLATKGENNEQTNS